MHPVSKCFKLKMVSIDRVVSIKAKHVKMLTREERRPITISHQSDIMLILDFEQHNIQLFQSLLEAVAPDLECRSKSRDTNVLSTVWLLSNDESYRGVADSFISVIGNTSQHFLVRF